MKSHNPTFQDRVASAAQAKQKALDQLRAKPPLDEAAVAARLEARLAREAREVEKRAAKEAARKEIADRKAAEAAEAAASAKPQLTEEERKAARDARYAARKNRK